MTDYLPDELALIGCPHRTDSMQPEKAVFQEEEEHVCDPFSYSGGPNGPTERAQIKYGLMEIDLYSLHSLHGCTIRAGSS